MYWLLTTALVNAAMALLVAGMVYFISRRLQLPAVAHGLWALVLIKLVAPPLVRLPVPVMIGDFTLADTDGLGWLLGCLVWVLTLVWVLGAAWVLALLVSRTYRFGRLVREVRLDVEDLKERVAAVSASAGLRSTPEVVLVRSAISPMLWGVGPLTKLLFPARLADRLPPQAVDALLLHELAHYSRGDQWMRVLEGVVRIVFWWNPMVGWVHRELEAAEEACCDAWVIARQPAARRGYAEALLATIDFLAEGQSPTPALASGLGDAPLLRERLTQIVAGPTVTELPASWKVALFAAAVVVLPVVPVPMKAFDLSQFTPSRPTFERAAVQASVLKGAAAEPLPDAMATAAGPEALIERLAPLRPKTPVTAVAISPDGRYRLERRKSSEVTLVHADGAFRLSLVGNRILGAAFTPDSGSVVTGHVDGQVRVWDCDSGGLLLTLREGMEAIWSVSVVGAARGGAVVAAGCADGTVVVWNLPSGEEAYRLASLGSGVSCLRWSPDGERLAICYGDFDGSSGSESARSKLVVWSWTDGQTVFETALERPIAAAVWRSAEELAIADWSGEAILLSLGEQATVTPFSLGADGKRVVEAAHWSANCQLANFPSSLSLKSIDP